MANKKDTIDFSVESSAFLIAAASLFILPLRWIIGWLTVCFVHELFHLAALKLCRAQIWQIRVGPKGVQIVTDELMPMQEACCSIAGPLGSGLCVYLSRLFPEAAVCAFIQGAFNLLPLYPLDGGRCVKSLLSFLIGSESADRVIRILHLVVIIALLLAAMYVSIRCSVGILPILIAAMIVYKTKKSLH